MNPALSPALHDLTRDPAYSQLKEYVIDVTGLSYYADKDEDLIRRLGRRWSVLGVADCRTYLQLLRTSPGGSRELDALVEEITIGESYFFRHSDHFTALLKVVLPDILARKAQRKSLRIWSAGCADGTEPYSLSILLRRELSRLVAGWTISILGTDINRQYLAKAREGQFDEWSLRTTSDDLRQACFRKDGKHWYIAPEYKEGVSFQFHNLMADAPPFQDASAFDLIICRNVMIYFAPERMAEVVNLFHDNLVPGGWLLVGPSEPNMTCFTAFETVNAPGVTLYRKPASACKKTASASPSAFALFSVSEASPLPIPQQASANIENATTLARLRDLTSQKRWADAVRCGELLLQTDQLNPLVHFYHASALEHTGRRDEAERSLRRAIYLDRQFIPAHYQLGQLSRSAGDKDQAARCFKNTLQLLDARSDTETIPDVDDLTVAQLRELVKAQISSEGESA